MTFSWKSILNVVGGALGLLGVAFVIFRLRAYWEEVAFGRLTLKGWFVIVLLFFIYGGSNLFLAKAWHQLLEYLNISIGSLSVIRIYGLSQLAKYVPGNIFHLAGRQALGMAAGMSSRNLVKSTLWELGLLAFAGGLFSPLTISLIWERFPYYLSVGLFFLILSGASLLVRRFISPRVNYALLGHCLFLALTGGVFVILIHLISRNSLGELPLASACGAYVISWLAGFITPGAPAGVGIRELVLLFLLKGLVMESDLLLVIVLGRVVTVVGDVLFFLSALIIRNSGKQDR